MQATFQSYAEATSPRLMFARRGTMVRSEKRRRHSPQLPPERGYDRPPRRRRRPSAGFFYKLVTLLLLLIVWPIGLILLWQRRLRWSTLAKLFTSVITLMACILLIGTALTVDTHNARYTAIQNEAIGFLDSAADSLIDFSAAMNERAERSLAAIDDIRDLYGAPCLNWAADAIDWGVAIAADVRENVGDWLDSIAGQPEATPQPAEATDEPEGEPADEATEEPGATESAAPGATHPIIAGEVEPEATPAPTSAPAADIRVSASGDELPVYIPEAAPDPAAGIAATGGMLLRSGALDADALPTPTPEPEPEDLTFTVKPASQATVYFNIGSGKFYHMTPVCGSMKNADAHTFAETAENIHEPCERCTPPDKELLHEVFIAWLDEGGTVHLTDECPDFEGQWTLLTAQDAIDAGHAGCPTCGADRYLEAIGAGQKVRVEAPTAEAAAAATAEGSAEPTPEPTPEPTLAPTPEPSPQVVTPRETLKPAGEAIVYHSSNGRFYHMNDHCSGMTGGDSYTLQQCVAGDYQQCNTCGAPAPECVAMLCLWRDEDDVCHVSDECEYFVGQYALIARDDALNQGLVGCSHCGAVDYLIPFTVVDTYESLGADDTL